MGDLEPVWVGLFYMLLSTFVVFGEDEKSACKNMFLSQRTKISHKLGSLIYVLCLQAISFEPIQAGSYCS